MDLRNAFRKSSIALSLLGCATLGSACFGHSSSKVKDDQLGRLSTADREQLIDRERDVNVAKANIDASEVALEEAKKFRSNSHDEAKAAKKEQEQIADGLKKAEKQGSPEVATLEQRGQLRAEQTNAMEAKGEYGDQLVDLRKAQVDDTKAEHELMEARLSRAQYDLLAKNNLSENLEASKFIERERKAEQGHAKTSQKVDEQMASARASKEAWTGLQQTAQGGVQQGPQAQPEDQGAPELIEAPRPPDSLKFTTGGSSSAAAKSGATQGEKSEKSQKAKSAPKAKQTAKTTPPAAPAAPQTAAPAAPATPQPAPAPQQAAPAPAAPQQPAPSVPTPPPNVPQP